LEHVLQAIGFCRNGHLCATESSRGWHSGVAKS
jgi:hypothetical protein